MSSRTVPGSGVVAQVVGPATADWIQPLTAVMGKHSFCLSMGLVSSPGIEESYLAAKAAGRSTMLVGWDGEIRGCYTFDEQLRPGIANVVESLDDLGMQVTLLTGDQNRRARRLASQLKIEVLSELLPADKLAHVRRLQEQGSQVAMVGDGLNDAPSLSAADVGIAMGCGVEVSRDAADVCLISSNLELLPWAVQLARDTARTIRRNLVWAVAYNMVGIAIASTGRLNPIFAACAMVLSSVFVITESLRLANRAAASAPQLDGMTYEGDKDIHRATALVPPPIPSGEIATATASSDGALR